jgi:RNA ligase (TIGR02306 family)
VRKLASVRRIDAIRPIEGADAIVCAAVGGWNVVVKKDEFKPGDLAIYIEIDAWVPHALAPFLSKGQAPREYEGVKGERLRTVKLRGQISQGLLLPLSVSGAEGDDLTAVLGIQKWEMPIPAHLSGQVRGAFPSCVPKTDQERVQNLDESDLAKHGPYELTEKLDGTSCTFYLDLDGDFHVCSRNLDLKRNDDNTLWRIAKCCDLESNMKSLGLVGVAVQGEVIGEGIQGNYYNLKGQAFFAFDVYDAGMGRYLTPEARARTIADLALQPVPVIAASRDCFSGAFALDIAQGLSMLVKKEREGLVFKSTNADRFSFKAISNRFLLKQN